MDCSGFDTDVVAGYADVFNEDETLWQDKGFQPPYSKADPFAYFHDTYQGPSLTLPCSLFAHVDDMWGCSESCECVCQCSASAGMLLPVGCVGSALVPLVARVVSNSLQHCV